jgi:hypothetical protein
VKRTIVQTAFAYPLIWDKGQLEVRIDEKVFEVVFRRRYRQEEGDDVPMPNPGFMSVTGASHNVEQLYDRW